MGIKRKGYLLGNEVTASQALKRQNKSDDLNSSESESTMRQSQDKSMRAHNAKASARGIRSAEVLGKRTSKQKDHTQEILVPLQQSLRNNKDYERVVFIDNVTLDPKVKLYRKTEKSETMSHMWRDFIAET